ncbi:MAG: hypothetical protein ACSLFD_09995 [Solirubrobacterales bacterium]
MDDSPQGREIKELYGDAGTIINRGNQIKKLGDKMISSAAVLKQLADGASGQEGLAVDKLQEVVGDSYKELKLAGERYKPTGPILVTYGNKVNELKPLIKAAVTNCESEWSRYISKSDAWYREMETPVPLGDDTNTNPELDHKDDVKDAKKAMEGAYDDWEDEARIFDGHYDDWKEAFDKAANAIEDATDGGISDGFWDNVDGVVDVILTVLAIAGLILTLLVIIVGGPFLLALAAIVAIATLLFTIYAFARGDKTGWDLAFAIVGVIPFGSVGKLFSGGKLAFLADLTGGLSKTGGIKNAFGGFRNMLHAFPTGFSRGGGGLAGLRRGAEGLFHAVGQPGNTGVDMFSMLMTGRTAREIDALSSLSDAQKLITVFGSVAGDVGAKTIANLDTLVDLLNDDTGLMDMYTHDSEMNRFEQSLAR